MIARKCTQEDLFKALSIINLKYADNVQFNRFDFPNFTLRVKDSHKAGHRFGFNATASGKKRYLVSTCWHVHGDFFDALFKVNPDAYIWSGGRRIDITQGNWEDRNIGSVMSPLMYSDACECNSNEVTP